MRTEVTAFVAKEDGHARFAPKGAPIVTYKKRRLPMNFNPVELQEEAQLKEWVEDQFRNVIL